MFVLPRIRGVIVPVSERSRRILRTPFCPMRIAIGIVKLLPVGGLEKDCLAVAQLLRARCHSVDIFTTTYDRNEPKPPGLRILTSRALRNHVRDWKFGRNFQKITREGFDVVVGFNKLPGLDVLYCADPCVADRQLAMPLNWMPRHKTRIGLERVCFAEPGVTEIALLTTACADSYRRNWGTERRRIRVLRPSLEARRCRAELRTDGTRARVRETLGLSEQNMVCLWVGTQPGIKGLDRVLEALVKHRDAVLLVVGPTLSKMKPYQNWAKRAGIAGRIKWLGYRTDVSELMASADVLVHPARLETTGNVILEALATGLPVIVSEVCGFAEHVARAAAGVVIPEPFQHGDFCAAVESANSAQLRRKWSASAVEYIKNFEDGDGIAEFVDLIEKVAERRRA